MIKQTLYKVLSITPMKCHNNDNTIKMFMLLFIVDISRGSNEPS